MRIIIPVYIYLDDLSFSIFEQSIIFSFDSASFDNSKQGHSSSAFSSLELSSVILMMVYFGICSQFLAVIVGVLVLISLVLLNV